MRKISYILPIYNEAENIGLLYDTLAALLKPQGKRYNFELLFINDGSQDNSLKKLQALAAQDRRVVVLNFSRNFGHQIAVTAGLDVADGDAVIIMDSDLQDPPAVSLELIDKWEQGFDVVYAQRRSRKDTPFKQLTAQLYYWALAKIADINIPRNTGDFRLMDRKVVESLKRFNEHNRFLRGMVSFVGFKQTAVLFDRDERHAGTTGYPLKKMAKFAADGIISFSWAPLKLITRLGYLTAFLSFLGIIYVLYVRIFEPSNAVPGWAFVMIAVLLVGGVQTILLGIVGSYIGRIYTEAQGRPLYIIESITRAEGNPDQ
ncbi:MAG TPA: glycosyltransferase [Candidatus Acidoferrum sp.]|nr:glycosyltransferase [Candidatus Acidoferrum sp.]